MSIQRKNKMTFVNNVITMPELHLEPKEGLGSVLFKYMKIHKGKIAQIDIATGDKETFGDLLNRCINTAIHLQEIGITRKDVICLCANNHMDTVVPYIASQFLGCKIACANTSTPSKNLSGLLNLVKPKIMFLDQQTELIAEKIIEESQLNTQLVVFGESTTHSEFSEFLLHQNTDDFHPVHIENLKDSFAIYFSSGTTGVPKGICLNHYSILSKLFNPPAGDEPDLNRIIDDKGLPLYLLSNTTMNWISTVIFLCLATMRGLCRLICAEKISGIDIIDAIEQYKPKFVVFNTFYVLKMIEAIHNNNITPNNQRLFFSIIGSKIADQKFVEIRRAFPEADVFQAYGQTEASGGLTTFNSSDKKHKRFMRDKIGSVGLPINGVSYKVVDVQTNMALGPNQPGELHVKTKFVMNGYLTKDNAPNAFTKDGWLKTGDIVCYDEDFCFYIVDRLSEVFLCWGSRIIPAMIENHLYCHPDVRQAVVVGIPCKGGKLPVALIVPRRGAIPNEKDINQFLENKVNEKERINVAVRCIQEMALTTTNKVDRAKARQIAMEMVE